MIFGATTEARVFPASNVATAALTVPMDQTRETVASAKGPNSRASPTERAWTTSRGATASRIAGMDRTKTYAKVWQVLSENVP